MKLYNLRISVPDWKPTTSLVPNKAFINFYKYVAHSIFDIEITKIDAIVRSINISSELPLTPQWNEFEKTLLAFFEEQTLTDSIILIHVTDIIKTTDYFEIICIYDKIKNKFHESNIKTIFYVRNYDNILAAPLSHEVGVSEDYVFLNEEGEYTFSYHEIKVILDFEKHIDNTAPKPEDGLKLKLIRKIGHFIRERDGKHISCQKYFYDGSYCREEINKLFYTQISDTIDKHKSFGICISCHSSSKWADICLHYIYECFKGEYSSCYGEILKEKDDFNKVDQIVLLADVVVSGETLREKYNEIEKELTKPAKIIPLSILYCGKKNPDETIVKGKESIPNGDSDIVLHYLLERKQEYHNKETDNCVMCKKDLDIYKKKFNEETNPYLSSFEMWSMVDESELSEEHTTPPSEENEKDRFKTLIPDTLKLVRSNCAYMASMFPRLLAQNGLNFPSSGFIAYPDETNNEHHHYQNLTEDQVPSNLFVSSLKLMHEYNILPIPRGLIEDVKKDASFLEKIEKDHNGFYRHLLGVKNEAVIIVDEFPRTYGTYKAMHKILSLKVKTLLAYVTLFNFSPDGVKANVESPMKHFNFYEFQYE